MKRLLLALLLLLLFAGLSLWELQRRWELPLAISPEGYRLEISSGDSLAAVTRRLHGDGVLAHPLLLRAWGRYSGLDLQIRRGEYLLRSPLTATGLLTQLTRGDVVTYQVTLPEGITLANAIERLAQEPALQSQLAGPADPWLGELVDVLGNPEGLFFPDTYQFERGASDRDLLRRAYLRMQEVLAREWDGRSPNLPYETPYEVLIMASLVERETGVASERADIAGVFVRRLRRGMRLQTDPAVIYGLGQSFDGNLRRAHLLDETNPYNTYRHFGLPPTPIALPGQAAIHAALHPAEGDSLYFVARGDGSHQFSQTLAEHQAAVRQYQLQRAKNYRSSPGEL